MKNFSLSLLCLLGLMVIAQAAPAPKALYLDPTQPLAKRVDALVSQMTLEEKVDQMMTDAPAIPRLGVPAYYWWSECLHGDAVTPATVFPQAIALASTWDIPLHSRVATAISDEDRATYNKTVQPGTSEPFHGLTFFSPNINIFRDPRWGRGQETYGEDPYLTSRFGVAYVKGLQGSDPRYLKVVATPKHFAVHSGPELERHRFDAVISNRDLYATYLPAFEACVREGHAYSVMGAYSALDGVPDCASDLLLEQNLRQKWGFDGYVVSDCGAIGDISGGHHYAKTPEEGAADAVKAGCDLSCGGAYHALVRAVQQGLLSEADIDRSVKRLFTARFRLGMFDPPQMVPYDHIPYSVVDSPAHRKLALQAARESIVLLKNEGGLLPLKKNIQSLAVIGPNANDIRVLLGNYNGHSSRVITALQGIKSAVSPQTIVEYVQGTGLTGEEGELSPIPSSALRSGNQPGLHAEYFSNATLQGKPAVTRQDRQVDLDWAGGNPVPPLPADNISARWTGELVAPQDGDYTLGVRGDDGFRLYIDGQKVIDDWTIHPAVTRTYQLTLKAGQPVSVRLEYFQAAGQAEIALLWRPAGQPRFGDALAAARRADAVIYVGGISSVLEGEEGTNGNGDRSDMNLPAVQKELLQALSATGKPVVLVLMSGSALSVVWAKEHIPAIVEAWYPGEEGGTALADVLFGNYNPAGRLPVTFYQSVAQLPPFEDYAMQGRTYRYFTGEPLYSFGYGLSYTRFQYSRLQLPAASDAHQPVTVRADVKNTGARSGDEVVELYLKRVGAGPDEPLLHLDGFQRISLKPGAQKTVTFTLRPEQFTVVNAAGNSVITPGPWQVFVGGGQPNLAAHNAATSPVLAGTVQIND